MVSLRRGFNRLFIVLAACWAIYWLFVFPFVAAREDSQHYGRDVNSCGQMYGPAGTVSNDSKALQQCLSESEGEYATGRYSHLNFGTTSKWEKGDYWSYEGYYRHAGWFLVGLIFIPPLVAYGLAWGVYGLALGLLVVCRWIWRGFRPASAN